MERLKWRILLKTDRMNIQKRIDRARQVLRENNSTACVIPTNDPHISEYTANYWKTRTYLSGFTGSAGTLIITTKDACLFTDGRYELQAKEELKHSAIDLVITNDIILSISIWLKKQLSRGDTILVNNFLFTIHEYNLLYKKLTSKNIQITSGVDIAEKVWKKRPPLPQEDVFIHHIKFSGETTADKLKRTRLALSEKDSDTLLLNSLNDIAWLFNIRGKDIDYNPLTIAYAFIDNEKAILFISKNKLTKEVKFYLQKNRIFAEAYENFLPYLASIKNKTILLNPTKMNYGVFEKIHSNNTIIFDYSPIEELKSIKNQIEIQGFKDCMIKDGIALTRAFLWLENCLTHKKQVTEIDFAKKIAQFRSQQSLYYNESFAPIVGYKEHGAIVHYKASKKSNKIIQAEGLLLTDTGGHYYNGTTDITRTVALGSVNNKQKDHFTWVLKANIALSRKTFKTGTFGYQLDKVARKQLVINHCNYNHGTGHGVGHFSSVHEGPQSIRPDKNKVPLSAGMIVSNEPGAYFDNAYGIRTENLLLVKSKENISNNSVLHFEVLTLFPIDTSIINFSLMTRNELLWLNNYHKKIVATLSPFLESNEKDWLKSKCQLIKETQL